MHDLHSKTVRQAVRLAHKLNKNENVLKVNKKRETEIEALLCET